MLDVLMYKITLTLLKQLWFHPDLFIMVHTVGDREEQTVTHTHSRCMKSGQEQRWLPKLRGLAVCVEWLFSDQRDSASVNNQNLTKTSLYNNELLSIKHGKWRGIYRWPTLTLFLWLWICSLWCASECSGTSDGARRCKKQHYFECKVLGFL